MLGGSHGRVVELAGEKEIDRLNRQSKLLVAEELAFLRGIGITAGMRLMDLGCGTGAMSGLMADELGVDVLGIDANTALLPNATLHQRTAFAVGNAYDLTQYQGQFDAVVIRFMLQHIRNPDQVVAQSFQALRPGGIAVLIDSDDGYTIVSPPDREFSGLLAETQRRQAEHGGDRMIGRRLARLLADAGYVAKAEWVRVVTASEVGFDRLFALATGCKAAILGDSMAFASVGRRLSTGSGFFSVGVVAAAARRPE